MAFAGAACSWAIVVTLILLPLANGSLLAGAAQSLLPPGALLQHGAGGVATAFDGESFPPGKWSFILPPRDREADLFASADVLLKIISPAPTYTGHREHEREFRALAYLAEHRRNHLGTLTAAASPAAARYHPFPRPVALQHGIFAGRNCSFIQMSRVPGVTFREGMSLLRTAEEVLAAIHSLLDALEVLQQARLQHRDIDQSNVLLHGTDVYIVDFSHAVWPAMPATGVLPEQGRLVPPDKFTCGSDDIFSAGHMLAEAFWMQPPPATYGMQQLVFYMTRPKCTDRIRSIPALRDLLVQYGSTASPAPACLGPSSFAAPHTAAITRDKKCGVVTGQQTFTVCPGADGYFAIEKAGPGTAAIHTTLLRVRAAWHGIVNATVVDTAARMGLYAYMALLLAGAAQAKVLEKDQGSWDLGSALASELRMPLNYSHKFTQGDLVLAPWEGLKFLSCWQLLGTVEELVTSLAARTQRVLLLEWRELDQNPFRFPEQLGYVSTGVYNGFRRDVVHTALHSSFAAHRCIAAGELTAAGRAFIYVAVAQLEDVAWLRDMPSDCPTWLDPLP